MFPSKPTSKWNVLLLATATHTFAAAIPYSCLPSLFTEISNDLGLDLVQIGTVWGMVGAAMFVTLFGGWAGDKFGIRLTLLVSCCLAGLLGATRGLSNGFTMLALTVFMFGLARAFIAVNVHNTVKVWFQGSNLGMANGVVAMGMGVGLSLGPLLSGPLLSPLLGGWRNVLFLYGAVSILVGLLWARISNNPDRSISIISEKVTFREAFSSIVRHKGLLLLGFTMMFRMGSITGMIGYLPLYLRGLGWAPSSADGALATFFAASAIVVIPCSMLSDRLGSRKIFVLAALLMSVVGVGLISVIHGVWLWVIIIAVGIFFDAFPAIVFTMAQETKGLPAKYAGMALGMVLAIGSLGSLVAPPLGNSLASINAGLPFIFWASMSAVPLFGLPFIKETGRKRNKN